MVSHRTAHLLVATGESSWQRVAGLIILRTKLHYSLAGPAGNGRIVSYTSHRRRLLSHSPMRQELKNAKGRWSLVHNRRGEGLLGWSL